MPARAPRRWRLALAGVALCALTATAPAAADEILAGPYVQHVTPTQAWVLWEADVAGEVRWGEDGELTATAAGAVIDEMIQEASLDGLQPATSYSYQLVAGDASSEVHRFTTPPEDREQSFRFAAMSDMQRDGSYPDKYREIVHDGVIGHVTAQYGAEIDRELAFVLVAGDLVDNGWRQDQWRETFLAPGQALMAQVPYYPVLGNHEVNTPLYFDYLRLPGNGPEGLEERLWTLDRGNLRVIGLDSNAPFTVQAQLDWLETVLDDACADEALDFVVAQLHHPFLSELWLPGETPFTGEVIALLDEFATVCGKPAMHLFGHTHGYARGASRDHVHVWVNVASAGGRLDGWGEYDQADYDEFSVGLDEYGFVLVEVTAGLDPGFRVVRVGRGDAQQAADNVIRDEIAIRRYNLAPASPEGRLPAADAETPPECVNLVASPFCDPDEDGHGASQWQLADSCDDFSAPLLDRWLQHENWYFDEDTQAGDHLGDLVVDGLEPGRTYCWRTRHRDRALAWSPWSEPTALRTAATTLTDNLLTNPGAEDGTDGWEVVQGPLESVTDGECDGIAPYAGQRYFAVGGLCAGEEYGEARQAVDLAAHAAAIDAGQAVARFGGMLSTYSGSDQPEVELVFRDGDGAELGRTGRHGTRADTWTRVRPLAAVPAGARSAELVLTGTRNAGVDNDSYFDELELRLATDGSLAACLEAPPYPFADEAVECEPEEDPGDDDDSAGGDDDSAGGDDDGCKCAAGGGRSGWPVPMLLAAAAALRRRRAA